MPRPPPLSSLGGVAVNFTILGSGSAGNCAYLETDQARILIDAGFSGRQTQQRLGALGREMKDLTGILLTHEHSDHTLGLKVLAAKYHLPVFCNRLTFDAVQSQCPVPLEVRLFGTGDTFDLAALTAYIRRRRR